ncbi:MAG: dual specificity protein phosphatase family protein [Verrucomicrobia bacterium]|nr:dual specificity protein phosphatase family protein [Verrucomicrobiota bacterium]
MWTLCWFFPWLGLGLLSLALICLAVSPHRLPVCLLNEIALLNLRTHDLRGKPWWQEILPGLYLSGIPLQWHLGKIQQDGIQAVYAILDEKESQLASFLGEALDETDWVSAKITYVRLSSPDRHLLSLEQLKEAAGWIDVQRTAGKSVLVHCKGGRERSPMVVMAYLMLHQGLSLKEAKAGVCQRKLVHLQPSQELRMKELEAKIERGSGNHSRQRAGYH